MAVLDQETWVAVDVPEEFQVIVLSLPSTDVLVNGIEMPSTGNNSKLSEDGVSTSQESAYSTENNVENSSGTFMIGYLYRVPLIEETWSDLYSCLELIREAPLSKILSMEIAGKSGSYFMDVDFWGNDDGFSTGAYSARNDDIFVLSSIKPEAAEDLKCHGVTYCLTMVTEVSMVDEYQNGFRIKVAKNIGLEEEDLNKLNMQYFSIISR